MVPGLAATTALYPPGRLSIPGRMALTVALGYGILSALSFLLVAINVFRLALLVLLLLIVLLAAGIMVLRKASFAAHARAVMAEARDDPWPLIAGLLAVAIVVVTRLQFSPLQNLRDPTTPWRYWADGLELADAGGVPDQTLHWGATYVPAVSKILLSSFGAGVSSLIPEEPIPIMAAFTWLSAVGLALCLWWLGRELGLRLAAPLLPLFVTLNNVFLPNELAGDLKYYRAETFGRIVAFSALALGTRGLRERQKWKESVFAGIAFGVGSGTHLVPTVLSLGMLVWFALFVLVRERAPRAVTTRLAVLLAIAALTWGTIHVLSSGDLGFQGVTGTYSEINGNDPTALFTTGEPRSLSESAGWYTPPAQVLDEFVAKATGLNVSGPYLFVGGWLVVTLAVVVFGRTDVSRAVSLVCFGLTVTLLSMWLLSSYFGGTYVTASIGIRRLDDYAFLPFVLLLLAGVEAGLHQISKLRLMIAGIAATCLVLLAAALFIPSTRPAETMVDRGLKDIEFMNWIRGNTPCDARILSNLRSGGTFQVLTGRTGILEGMGPHLRPGMLNEVVELIIDARRFFTDPGGNRAFVERNAIDYLVVVKGLPGGVLRNTHVDLRAVHRVPFLRLVHVGPKANIYELVGVQSPPDMPRPHDFPGYRCRKAPIEY